MIIVYYSLSKEAQMNDCRDACIGDIVRVKRDNPTARVWADKLPHLNWWQRLWHRPEILFTVMSERFQEPRCGIGGTYSTIVDENGNQYEIPRCFLQVVVIGRAEGSVPLVKTSPLNGGANEFRTNRLS